MENSQKIRKKCDSALKAARLYFEVLSVVNDLKLTKKEAQFLAYFAAKGKYDKQGFIDMFESSEATVVKILKNLRALGLLTKDTAPTIHPALLKLDFTQNINLNILIEHETN